MKYVKLSNVAKEIQKMIQRILDGDRNSPYSKWRLTINCGPVRYWDRISQEQRLLVVDAVRVYFEKRGYLVEIPSKIYHDRFDIDLDEKIHIVKDL